MTYNAATSDAQLIASFKEGNESAFDVLLERYKDKIYTTIYLIVKDRYIAEDLLQETFIKIINRLKKGRYNEEGKFGSWAGRIGHNMAVDYFRKKKRHPFLFTEDGNNIFFQDEEFTEESIESVQIRKDTHQKLRELIETLPEAQRNVLMMRHFAEMSFQEIAEATDVSINTALGRMRYALINLRKKFDQIPIAYGPNNYR